MYFAGKFPAPVATALPAGHWPISLRIRSSSRMISGPPARWMAPSTPPPPASAEFAALTIASAATRVISPSRKATVCPDGLVHSMLSITIDERPHAKLTGHWRGRRRRRNRGARRQYLLHTARRAHRSERPCPQSAHGSPRRTQLGRRRGFSIHKSGQLPVHGAFCDRDSGGWRRRAVGGLHRCRLRYGAPV